MNKWEGHAGVHFEPSVWAPETWSRLLAVIKCHLSSCLHATLLYRRGIIKVLPAPQACQGLIFFPDLLQRSREANISAVPSEHILGAWKCHISWWSRYWGNSIQWDPFEVHFAGDRGRKEETKGQTFTRGRTVSCDSLTSVLVQRPFSVTEIGSSETC